MSTGSSNTEQNRVSGGETLGTQPANSADAIVFFDGVCGLCNHSVNWLLVRDTHRKLRFAPLQGSTAAFCVPRNLRDQLSTLVFQSNGKTFIRSGAVARILMTLGGMWWLAGFLLWLIPFPLRDLGYRIVSRLRYQLFGKHDACRLPTPAERSVFLD
ncbi:MAG: thiol-disulfide oxidoreductase DCC family protein [Planctomycetota bacterium]